MKRKNLYITGAIALVVIIAIAALVLLWPKSEARARAAATNFVAELKNISLTAETGAIQAAIDQYYSPYVTDDLLDRWKESPESAPGREVSSPWPDRIFIKNVAEQGAGFVINADVLYMSSAEEATPEEDAAGVMVVMMLVIPTDDGWKVAAYEELFSEGLDGESIPPSTDPRG